MYFGVSHVVFEEVKRRLGLVEGRVGFYYKNLVTGEVVTYEENEKMMAASVIKLMILTEAFRQMEEGTAKADEVFTIHKDVCVPSCGALTYLHDGVQVTLEDLCVLMIILSDNTATNVLIDRLGEEQINQTIKKLGFKTTQLNRKMFDSEKSAKGIQNYITAYEMGQLLEKMYKGELVSLRASKRMLEILSNQRLNSKIPFFLHSLMEETSVAHKTGEDTGITHDVGIVYGRQPFIVCFCGNEVDVPTYERVIADLSLMIYESLEENKEE